MYRPYFEAFKKSGIFVSSKTIHSSKGLESRICIMANADGITELKLLYVAMTRASQRLYIHAFNFANSTIAQKIKEGNLIEADSIQENISDNLFDLKHKRVKLKLFYIDIGQST